MRTCWTKSVAVWGWTLWVSGCGAGPSGGMDATRDGAAMDASPSPDTRTNGEDAALDSREGPLDSSSNADVTSTDVTTSDATAQSDPPTGDFIAFDLVGVRRVYSSFHSGSRLVVSNRLSAAAMSLAGQVVINVAREPGTLSCSQAVLPGILWQLIEYGDGSSFHGAMHIAGSSCEAITTAGGTTAGSVVTGTFTATLVGVSGPRMGQSLMLSNGRFRVTHP